MMMMMMMMMMKKMILIILIIIIRVQKHSFKKYLIKIKIMIENTKKEKNYLFNHYYLIIEKNIIICFVIVLIFLWFNSINIIHSCKKNLSLFLFYLFYIILFIVISN
jgi:hypothetical protein